MMIGKELSLAGKQLFYVPHLPFGGTRGEMSGSSYVSYLSSLKKRTDVMSKLLVTISRIQWTEAKQYVGVSG